MTARVLTMDEIIAMYPPGSARARFWEREREQRERLEADGEFWADAVARLKREKRHAEAATICRNAKPVPASFRELLVCLRAAIKERLKAGRPDPALLDELYATAVEASALCTPQTVTTTRPIGNREQPDTYPAPNAACIYYALAQVHGLPLDYQNIGYEQIAFLNKTDRRWIVDAWGEPAQHRDPCAFYGPIWEAARELFTREQEAEDWESRCDWAETLGRPKPPRPASMLPQSAEPQESSPSALEANTPPELS